MNEAETRALLAKKVKRMLEDHSNTLSEVFSKIKSDAAESISASNFDEAARREHSYHIMKAVDLLIGELDNLEAEASAAERNN